MKLISYFLLTILLVANINTLFTSATTTTPTSNKPNPKPITNNKGSAPKKGGTTGGGIPGFGNGIPGFSPGSGFQVPGFGNIGGAGGYGSGFGGPKGGYSKGGIIRPSVVCKDKGPCFNKKLICPAKCFTSYSRSGKNYGAGGGGGGCTMDCKKKCVAYC
ncbi:hypothetical protein AQUCO_06500040v1 [Aquilegia coerulea]|uniref:Glycine-rich protein n=1 Tax=Aquilegia coerulea TaxID=218851 RepID=A0A2G5CCE3_AQUCA|nr:hypothetical protein AQUCO_06500040v1 [Aquilegia coerulea]